MRALLLIPLLLLAWPGMRLPDSSSFMKSESASAGAPKPVVKCSLSNPTRCTVRQYARLVVLDRWKSAGEWSAAVAVITPESNFNPCASYPSRHDCHYSGSSSCGVPQANPCPNSWRGRLWETRYAQCRWFVDYVGRRYGSPSNALSFRRGNGWY